MSDRIRILVVDDDPSIRHVLASALGLEYEVVTADNGQEALDRLPHCEPDLMVVDVMMPKMDGLTLAKEVREHPRFNAIPFVFLSALNSRHDVVSGYETGADIYLTKPFAPDRLQRNLEMMLRERGVRPTPKRLTLDQIQEEEKRVSREGCRFGKEWTKADDERPAPTPPPATDSARSMPRLLAVDEDRDTLRRIKQMLQYTVEVVVSEDGLDAIHQMPHFEPDLFIVDLDLPKTGGFKLIELIRQMPLLAEAPVLVIADSHTNSDQLRVEELGAHGILKKPFREQDLMRFVRNMLKTPGFAARPKQRSLELLARPWGV